MNTKNFKSSLLLGAMLLTAIGFFGACKKKDPSSGSTMGAIVPAYPQPGDADAVLVAVNSTTPSPVAMPTVPGMPAGTEITIDYGIGVALFKGNAKADKVLLNDTELTFTNGVYTWLPNFKNVLDPTTITGIKMDGGIKWNITNPNIDKTVAGGIPGKPRINSGKTVEKSAGYTITNNPPSSTQKVLYGIYDDKGKYVHKEVNGSSNSCNFTAAELASLGSTKNGMIQANAYRISNETINGKKVYFVSQSSYTVTGVEIK